MKRQYKSIWSNPNYRYVIAFVLGIQKIIALQPLARLQFFTDTFGDTEGAKFSERFDKYGLWFLIDQFTDEQKNDFFDGIYTFIAAQKVD